MGLLAVAACGGSNDDAGLPGTPLPFVRVTSYPARPTLNLPLYRDERIVVWPTEVSDDGGATTRSLNGGQRFTQVSPLEVGASFAVALDANTGRQPLVVWDFKGNQFFPIGAGTETVPVKQWVSLPGSPSYTLFAITGQTPNVWRSGPSWTALPLLVAGERPQLLAAAGRRIVAVSQTGAIYVLEADGAAFVAAPGVKLVGAPATAVPLTDGRVALTSIGQPDKLYLFDPALGTLTAPRDLPSGAGEARVVACRDGQLANDGRISKDGGATWEDPLRGAFANLLKHGPWKQEIACSGDRVFVTHNRGGFQGSGYVFEVARDGSWQAPTDAVPSRSGEIVEARLAGDEVVVFTPYPQVFDGKTWKPRDLPGLPVVSRTGVWHAYPYDDQRRHLVSRDRGATWIEGEATHDGKPGANSGNIRATFTAGAGDEIWAVSGDEVRLFNAVGTRLEFDLLRSPDGAAFRLVAESTYEDQLVAHGSTTFGKRLDVVGVTPSSTVVTSSQIAYDGRTLTDLPLAQNEAAAAVFEDGKILTEQPVNTANGNVLTMHVRDVAGLGGSTFVPTVDGKTFANPVAVLGIDAQRAASGSTAEPTSAAHPGRFEGGLLRDPHNRPARELGGVDGVVVDGDVPEIARDQVHADAAAARDAEEAEAVRSGEVDEAGVEGAVEGQRRRALPGAGDRDEIAPASCEGEPALRGEGDGVGAGCGDVEVVEFRDPLRVADDAPVGADHLHRRSARVEGGATGLTGKAPVSSGDERR
jgi:hypothetical protein